MIRFRSRYARFLAAIACLLPLACILASCGAGCGGDPVLENYHRWLRMGRRAEPEIGRALASPDWRTRTHAILAASKTGATTFIPVLRELLRTDPVPAVVDCSIVALGRLGAREAVPDLVAFLAPGTPVPGKERLVLRALGDMRDPGAIDPLVAYLASSGDPAYAGEAADALLAIGDPRASVAVLEAMRRAPGGALLRYGPRVLGRLPAPGSGTRLIGLLDTGDPGVRREAVRALGTLRARPAIPRLARLLADGDPTIIPDLADALLAIGDSSATPLLYPILGSAEEERRMAAARVVGGLRHPAAGRTVYALLLRGRVPVDAGSVALGYAGFKPALPHLRQLFSSANEHDRDRVARGLALLGDQDAVPLLVAAFRKRPLPLSPGIVWSLGRLRAGAVARDLAALLPGCDETAVPVVLAALGEIGGEVSYRGIVAYFNGAGGRYALPVGSAVAKIGGSRAVAFIGENLDCGDASREQGAISALFFLRDPECARALRELGKGLSAEKRRYVDEALRRISSPAGSRASLRRTSSRAAG